MGLIVSRDEWLAVMQSQTIGSGYLGASGTIKAPIRVSRVTW